jgi:RNase adaptor protein for sRNA GlmZ degradation
MEDYMGEYEATNECVLPIKIAAQHAIEAENVLQEQLRATINSAFGDRVVTNISVKLTGIGVRFEVVGHWDLPKDLWF